MLRKKQDKLEKLQRKKNLIEFIIKRNQSDTPSSQRILQFPLIGMVYGKMSMQRSREGTIFRFDEDPVLYGDVDMLLQINKDSI